MSPISCEVCGSYYVSGTFIDDSTDYSPADRAHLSGWIRNQWRNGSRNIRVLTYDAAAVLKEVARLTPPEKADRLLLLFEKLHPNLDEMIPFEEFSQADAAAANRQELQIYFLWLQNQGFLKWQGSNRYSLTMEGWKDARRLKEQRKALGKSGFMALAFGHPELDSLVNSFYVPAAKAAGFDLKRLDEGQPAGLIDDQLRVRIRTAWFVVSDITHNNRGAYWEAGFAEGLGRPVIYSCEKSVFS
jgi:hypothetical protein